MMLNLEILTAYKRGAEGNGYLLFVEAPEDSGLEIATLGLTVPDSMVDEIALNLTSSFSEARDNAIAIVRYARAQRKADRS